MVKSKKLNLYETISMAVGTMIGASIFSVFGTGAEIAGNNLVISFMLSGVYALIVAYSYAKLGSKIVSNAGPISFIRTGIGENITTGTLSILVWFTYVVSISLFIKGFSGYFLPLLNIPSTRIATVITETVLVGFFIGLHFYGSKAVGKAEVYFVAIKVLILLLFIIGGFISFDGSEIGKQFEIDESEGIVNASVIFFLSFMGFGLITNTSENIKEPRKNVPRAIFISILIVLLIYLLISVITLGNLDAKKIASKSENVLAEAAKPFLGHLGFLLVSVGALFSLSSALNATIFGGANIAYTLARKGKLPLFFERKLWFGSTEGLYITVGLGLLIAIFFDINEVASITSTIFTVIYIFVLISHLRLMKTIGGKRLLVYFNLIIMLVVFLALMKYQWVEKNRAFWASIYLFLAAYIVEYLYRTIKHRKFKTTRKI